MIKKITLTFIEKLLLLGIVFCTGVNIHAQQAIIPQQLNGLEKLCAGGSFNEFYATFNHVEFPAETTFVIELSDKTGSFTSPIATILLESIDINVSQKTIKFALPVGLVGADTYSLRVKASNGVVSQKFKNLLGNTSFPAYYKDYESAFYINGKSDVAVICSGGNITLAISDVSTDILTSPLSHPNLKYNWYKDNVLIAGQTGTSIVVNSFGVYYVEIDYGQCSDENFSSNSVTVTSSSSGSAATINSSLGNPFCSDGNGTVLTASSGNSYIWKKDGVVITGTTGRTLTANDSGLYTVEVDFGGCSATGSINLTSNGFAASIDVPETNDIKDGETLSATVTTDATSPTFEWFLNGNLINNATTETYVVSVKGNYKVKISQASGCVATKEFAFKVSGPASQTDLIANIVKLGSYWNIPESYKNANTKVLILSSNGEKVLDVVNYQGDWPQTAIDIKNINPVYYYVIKSDTGEKKGSITVIK